MACNSYQPADHDVISGLERLGTHLGLAWVEVLHTQSDTAAKPKALRPAGRDGRDMEALGREPARDESKPSERHHQEIDSRVRRAHR